MCIYIVILFVDSSLFLSTHLNMYSKFWPKTKKKEKHVQQNFLFISFEQGRERMRERERARERENQFYSIIENESTHRKRKEPLLFCSNISTNQREAVLNADWLESFSL